MLSVITIYSNQSSGVIGVIQITSENYNTKFILKTFLLFIFFYYR